VGHLGLGTNGLVPSALNKQLRFEKRLFHAKEFYAGWVHEAVSIRCIEYVGPPK